MALTTTYQGWMDQQDKLEKDGQDTGIRKFREKVKEENGNKLIIFDQGTNAHDFMRFYPFFKILASHATG